MVTIGIGLLLETKQYVYIRTENTLTEESPITPFPVSVNAYTGVIIDSD